ncbi:hypothetical protein RJ55_03799 [Drechmeria coniospora]|nr:hypothetical protein RJ55_03799 [Drechmeria coniospora]
MSATAIDTLLRRAYDEGINLVGVKPAVLPGRGIGLVATRVLDKGDEIMTIPLRSVRSLDTTPEEISRSLSQDMTIHGRLASELALHPQSVAEWLSVVPRWKDFEECMPILWPESLQKLLPPEAMSVLAKQKKNFDIDWNMFRAVFTKVQRRDYLYAWLLVNTRTFYFETASMLAFPWHDRLALLPVADLFNHADAGCSVSFSPEGYTITADGPYRTGEEICISYGQHSNDYLLAEYGFLLQENRWDAICLDQVLLPRLSGEERSELERNGHLGGFMLHAKSKKVDSVWIALRLHCCVDAQWQNYRDGEEDAEGTLAKAAALLADLLEEYLGRVKEVREFIGSGCVPVRSASAPAQNINFHAREG